MWTRFLGGKKKPENITLGEWERFVDLRSSGEIDTRGNRVPETDEEGKPLRRPVRTRTVEADLQWLNLVLNWGVKWRTEAGRYLLRENPVRGYEIPKEKNVRRPVATQDRYEAIMKAIRENAAKKPKKRAKLGYLRDLLAIVNGTGRRISAVCQLRYEDLRLKEKTEARPFGAIRWPSDTDKTGRESLVPIGPDVRAALDRVIEKRPGIGPAPIFPSPKDPTEPVSRYVADAWLRRAEKLADLPPQKGSLWHAYRRKLATERKHLPDKDVMAAGGWSELESL